MSKQCQNVLQVIQICGHSFIMYFLARKLIWDSQGGCCYSHFTDEGTEVQRRFAQGYITKEHKLPNCDARVPWFLEQPRSSKNASRK